MPRGRRKILIVSILIIGALSWCLKPVLRQIGRFLILDEPAFAADAVVVLYTGVEYYSRLIEAARLYNEGRSKRVVINGNRKSDVLVELEKKGYETCCPWYEDHVRVLEMFGVPRSDIIFISGEAVYDTVSEADRVGTALIEKKMKRIILTTSKFHTRRAGHIWRRRFESGLAIRVCAAETDPFDPDAWWKQGRQIRWVLTEYGAWAYYYWKKMTGTV